jgi:hypothetical protein
MDTREPVDVTNLIVRLTALEAQNRSFRRWLYVSKLFFVFFVVVLILGSIAAATQKQPEAIYCSKLHLVDSKGIVRAELICTEKQVFFALRDAKQHERVLLMASEDQSGVAIANAQRIPVVHLAESGGGCLLLQDPSSKSSMTLAALKGGTALKQYDKDGKDRITIGIDGQEARIRFRDSHEKTRAIVGLSPEPLVSFLDSDEKVRFSLGLEKLMPRLEFRDFQQRSRLFLGLTGKGDAAFQLNDETGKALYSKP